MPARCRRARWGFLNPDKIKVQRTSVSGPLVTVLPKFGKGGFVPPKPRISPLIQWVSGFLCADTGNYRG